MKDCKQRKAKRFMSQETRGEPESVSTNRRWENFSSEKNNETVD